MTIVTTGSDDVVEQITKQLNKLVEVVKVVDLTDGNHIERELMLVKVRAAGKDRDEMKRLADIFRGRILDVTDKSYTIELTGTGSKLDAFLEAIDVAPAREIIPGRRLVDAAEQVVAFGMRDIAIELDQRRAQVMRHRPHCADELDRPRAELGRRMPMTDVMIDRVGMKHAA